MLSGLGTSTVRAAAIIPATLLVVFAGLLWLLGMPCGKDRQTYVIVLTQQAMAAAGVLLHGNAVQSAESPGSMPSTSFEVAELAGIDAALLCVKAARLLEAACDHRGSATSREAGNGTDKLRPELPT